jgi:hypothetical protein
MGVVDRAEDSDEAALPVWSERLVSRTAHVDRIPSLRRRHDPYRCHLRMRPAAMRPVIPPHIHRESKTHWCGMLMVGSTLDLRQSTRLATRFACCSDCDSDDEEELSDNEAYRACCHQIEGEASGSSSEYDLNAEAEYLIEWMGSWEYVGGEVTQEEANTLCDKGESGNPGETYD